MKYHIVKCKYCGADIERATPFKDGTCMGCKLKHLKENAKKYKKKREL
jgi:hypothetical protein